MSPLGFLRTRGNMSWRCSVSGRRNKGISTSLLPTIPRKFSSIQWREPQSTEVRLNHPILDIRESKEGNTATS